MLNLTVCHGRFGDEADLTRARKAAEEILDGCGVPYPTIYEDYLFQWRKLDRMPDQMDGLAKVWHDASTAASFAYTENWHNPDEVWVDLSA